MPLSVRLHYPRLLPVPDPTRHDISREYLHIYYSVQANRQSINNPSITLHIL